MEIIKCCICGKEIEVNPDDLYPDFYVTVEGEHCCEDCSNELHWCDRCDKCTLLEPETVLVEEIDYDGDSCYREDFWCKECAKRHAYKKNPNDDVWWA